MMVICQKLQLLKDSDEHKLLLSSMKQLTSGPKLLEQ